MQSSLGSWHLRFCGWESLALAIAVHPFLFADDSYHFSSFLSPSAHTYVHTDVERVEEDERDRFGDSSGRYMQLAISTRSTTSTSRRNSTTSPATMLLLVSTPSSKRTSIKPSRDRSRRRRREIGRRLWLLTLRFDGSRRVCSRKSPNCSD